MKNNTSITASSRKTLTIKRVLKRNVIGWALLLPAILCVYFFVIRPTFSGIFWSFFNMQGYKVTTFAWLANYKRILTDKLFLKLLMNTLKYVGWSLILGFPLPFIVAVCLSEVRRAKGFFRFFTYLPNALPGVAVYMIWFLMYYPTEAGLLNMFLSKFGMPAYSWLQDSRFTILYIIITMTWAGAGSTTIFYYAALQGIDPALYEVATLEGAGFFKRIRYVTIPQISGLTLLLLIQQVIGVFSIMEQPLQMTNGGPNNASMSLGHLSYQYGFVSVKPQLSMAVGVVMFLILIVMTSFYFKMNKKVESSF